MIEKTSTKEMDNGFTVDNNKVTGRIRLYIERQKLSDGSYVYGVVLDGKGSTVRVDCMSESDAYELRDCLKKASQVEFHVVA